MGTVYNLCPNLSIPRSLSVLGLSSPQGKKRSVFDSGEVLSLTLFLMWYSPPLEEVPERRRRFCLVNSLSSLSLVGDKTNKGETPSTAYPTFT